MSSMKLWICTLFAAVLVVFSTKKIPAAYEEIKNERLLLSQGRTITGRVIGHHMLPSGRDCRTQADIGYTVDGSAYTVRITGCGASARHLPVGREVDVQFLPFSPSIAKVTVPGASTPTYGWNDLLLLLGSLVLLLIGIGREWMRQTAARNRKKK